MTASVKRSPLTFPSAAARTGPPTTAGRSPTDAELDRRARRVLLTNWRRHATVPASRLYPHQWSWDSAFIAIGLRHLSPVRAQRELESLFGAQWPDGRVPHIVFDRHVPADAYFPGPAFWQAGSRGTPTSGIVQPPAHALAAWLTFRADPAAARARGFLPRIYPRLVAWHRYLTTRRDLTGNGLVSIVHPWESGLDNSPAWDVPLARVTPVPSGEFTRRDLDHAAAAERPTDTDYGRYVRLARDYRDAGYADSLAGHAFAVEDPLCNALLAAGEHALAAIAAEIGADPAPHRSSAARLTRDLTSQLYDRSSGTFFPRDAHTGTLLRTYSIAGLMPLIVPDLPVAAELIGTALGDRFRLADACPPPSYDLTAGDHDPVKYWRGPGWINTGWLLWYGLHQHGSTALADDLRRRLLNRVRESGFREYFDPLTGIGHGTDDFSWTAALALDLLRTPPHPRVWGSAAIHAPTQHTNPSPSAVSSSAALRTPNQHTNPEHTSGVWSSDGFRAQNQHTKPEHDTDGSGVWSSDAIHAQNQHAEPERGTDTSGVWNSAAIRAQNQHTEPEHGTDTSGVWNSAAVRAQNQHTEPEHGTDTSGVWSSDAIHAQNQHAEPERGTDTSGVWNSAAIRAQNQHINLGQGTDGSGVWSSDGMRARSQHAEPGAGGGGKPHAGGGCGLGA